MKGPINTKAQTLRECFLVGRGPDTRLFVPMAVGKHRNGPRWAAAGAGQGDEDLAANDPEVLGAVPVDAHTLLARVGGWPGPLITQMKEGSG